MKLYFLDHNKSMIDAWKKHFHPIFEDVAPVEFIENDFISFMESNDEKIDAVVSPANAYGLMDGGYDAALTDYFGNSLKQAVQDEIINKWFGEQPVGTSISLKIPDADMLIIHTPTMRTPSKIKDPTIIYQCMRTILIEIIHNNLDSVIIPALGGGTGMVESEVIAKMMHLAYLQVFDGKEREKIDWGIALEQKWLLNRIVGYK